MFEGTHKTVNHPWLQTAKMRFCGGVHVVTVSENGFPSSTANGTYWQVSQFRWTIKLGASLEADWS